MKKPLLLAIFLRLTVFSFAQSQENLKIVWPEEYKWKVGSNQEDDKQHMIEMIPGIETIDKWTIIGTMLSIKGVQNVPMDVAMNLTFDQAKQNAINPTLSLIERNDTTKNAWIIFKIEASGFKDDKTPESQLYYIIQGNSSLYSNFVAVKKNRFHKILLTSGEISLKVVNWFLNNATAANTWFAASLHTVGSGA